MGIQSKYSKVDDIPEMTVKELFTEKDGGMVFTGLEGLKTKEDTDRLEEALRKERNDHGQSKEKLKSFDGVDAEQAKKAIADVEMHKLNPQGAIMSEEVQEHIRKKITDGIASEKERGDGFETQVNEFLSKENVASHKSFISKLADPSISSSLNGLVTRDLMGLTEKDAISGEYVANGMGGYEKGTAVSEVLAAMIKETPDLAKGNTASHPAGGTNTSGGGTNPFAKETFNRTDQHKMTLDNPTLAESMKAQAEKE